MTPMQCQAFTASGNRCRRDAKHFHETPGDALYLCNMHYRMITKRMRRGSDEEYVRAWREKLGSD